MTEPYIAGLSEPGSSRIGTVWGRATYIRKPRLAAAVSANWASKLRPFYPPGAIAEVMPGSTQDAWVEGQVSLNLQADSGSWIEKEEVWVEYPDQSRVEGVGPGGLHRLNVVSLRAWSTHNQDGSTRAGVRPTDPRGRAIERELAPRHHEAALALLQPRWLLHGFALRSNGNAEIAGRRAIRMEGKSISDARTFYDSGGDEGPNVFQGADKVEFLIDADRGVVLRWAGIAEGEEYEATNFTTITFDAVLDDHLFDLAATVTGQDRERCQP